MSAMISRSHLEKEAIRFRKAILTVKEAGGFPADGFHFERMNSFPIGCCDDTADLFSHYLFEKYGIESIRVDGTCFDKYRRCSFNHSWQVVNGWIVDLTGDQFDFDPALRIKLNGVFVGDNSPFHRQFTILYEEPSNGILSLGEASHERMYRLYEIIMNNIEHE